MNTAKKLSIRLEAVGGDKVRQEFKNIGSDGQKAFQRITQVITPANDNLKVLDNTAKAFNNTLKQAASLAGAYLGLRGLTSTFKSIVGVNAEFERLSGSLKTVTSFKQRHMAFPESVILSLSFLSYSADAADFGATNPHIQYIIGLKGIAIMIVVTPTKRQYIRQAKPSKITFRTMPQIFKAFVAVAFLIVVSIVIIF